MIIDLNKLYKGNLVLKIFWTYELDKTIGNNPKKVSREILSIIKKGNLKDFEKHQEKAIQDVDYDFIYEAVKESFELSIYAN